MTEDVAAPQTATTLLPALRRTSGSSPCSVFCKSGFNINLRKRSPHGLFAAVSTSRDSSPYAFGALSSLGRMCERGSRN